MGKRYQGKYDPYHAHASAGGGVSSSATVILYQPSEAAPLLPGKTRSTRTSMSRLSLVGGLCLALVFSFLVYQTSMHAALCPPDTATRDAIRLEWKNEQLQHNVLKRDWERASQEQAEKEQAWKRAMEQHEREVERRVHEEHERRERAREEWHREVERHIREFEELQSRERRERERERERWRQEVEERDRLEEEERQKLNMFWGRVEAHTCSTYATREYTAQLMNLPRDWKRPMDACKATPLEIHGISYLPKTCEVKGPGVAFGRWEFHQQEPDCATFWEEYYDKGCTSPGSGKKYITHKLMNLPEKSDWKEFCATTPIRFNHMEFPGAQECFTTVFGVYGQWEIDDDNC